MALFVIIFHVHLPLKGWFTQTNSFIIYSPLLYVILNLCDSLLLRFWKKSAFYVLCLFIKLKLLGSKLFKHRSKYFFLCSAEEEKKVMIGMTWGWENDVIFKAFKEIIKENRNVDSMRALFPPCTRTLKILYFIKSREKHSCWCLSASCICLTVPHTKPRNLCKLLSIHP